MRKETVILPILGLFLFFAQCNRRMLPVKCVSPAPIALKNFILQSNNNQIEVKQAKVKWIDSVQNLQKVEEIGLDSLTFNSLFNDWVDDGHDSRKFLYVLYVDGILNSNEKVTLDSIAAIAVYYNAGDSYQFRLYNRNGTGFSELTPLTGKTYRITSNSLDEIALKIAFKDNPGGSLIYIDKMPPFGNYSIKGNELLYKRIVMYLKRN